MAKTYKQIKDETLGTNYKKSSAEKNENSKSDTNKKRRSVSEIREELANGGYDFSFIRNDLKREIGLDTLQSDLESSIKMVSNIHNGWQTKETMQNTLSSVKSMYDRLGKYQEYQKAYGGTDLSEVQNYLKSTLDSWDAISSEYGRYKNADAYNKEAPKLKELGGMTASDVKAVMDGFTASDIENKYKTAKKYDDAIKSITKNSMNVRSRTDADKVKASLQKATDTRDNYLKSIGYKSMEDLEKDMTGTRIAHTTVDGQNILWDDLYKQKKYEEDSNAVYKGISSSADFTKYRDIGAKEKGSAYRSAEDAVTTHRKTDFFDSVKDGFEDIIGMLTSGKSAPEYIADKSQDVNLGHAYLTKQEKDIYDYYLGKEKEGLVAKGTADKYLASIDDVLAERYRNRQLLHTMEFADKHPWLASGASVGLNVLSAGDAINNTVKYATKGELDRSFAADQSSAIRGTVSNKIDWEIGNWDAFDFVYNTGMSMADSAVAMGTMGVAGGTVLGLSAAAQGTNDALERGLDNKSAFWSGFSAGVFEGLFETFSISKLKAFKDAPVGGVKNIIKNVGKSMLTNASEETLTELANLTYDYFANGDLSEAKTRIRAYMNSGMSEKEAVGKVVLEQAAQVGEAGLSGALMGLGFGGTANYSAYRNNKAVGEAVKGNERTSEVFDIANNPEMATAYEAYTNYANKGVNADTISDAQLGSLYISAKQDAMETIESKDATPEQKASAMETLGRLALVDTENTIGKRAKEFNVGEETKVTESGETLEIKGIETSGDETFVVTDNGKVSVKDATLTQKDSELVAFAESISKTDGTDVANLFVSQYDGKMDLYEYANSFNLTVAYAKNNYRYDEILNKKGELTTGQVNAIYEEVRIKADKEKQEAINKLNKKMADGKFYKGFIDDAVIDYNNTSAEGKVNWNDLTARQREAITFVKGFAQATGMNLSFVANNPDFNGRYDKTSNTITINLDKGGFDTIKNIEETIIPTMSHETTHWMKEKSPELWRHLNEIVFSTLTEHYNLDTEQSIKDKIKILDRLEPGVKHTEEDARGRTITEEDLIQAEMNRSGKKEDVSREEIVSRACEDILKMSEQGRKIFHSLSETEQKGLVAKIKAIVKDLLTWVDNLLNSYDAKSEEARIMREYKEQLQKAEKVWSEMLKKSVVANQSMEKSGAYAHTIDEGVSKDSSELLSAKTVDGKNVVWIEENILKENKGQPVHQFIANFIAEHIGEAYTIIESGQKVYIGEELPSEYTQSEYTQTILRNNPNILKVKNKATANVGEIIEIATNRKWEKAEHSENKDAKYGIYKYNTRFGFPVKDAKGNIVGANIYKAKLVIRNASDGKKYLYDIVSIKKDTVSSDWLSKKIASTATRVAVQKNVVSKNSILHSDEKVKELFSDKDSIGRELSNGQQKYFKDSVVRDDSGNLQVMYRGDSSDFTAFDKKKTNYANLYGRGFYFTNSKAHAEQYGKSREFYLDIKNPLSPKQNAITKKQMLKFLKAIENDGEDYDLYNYGEGATAESVLNLVWGKGDFEMLQDISASAVGDLVGAIELFNEVNGTSYDGIILPTETVTFNSEQAKLTSNLNPTEDKDIRYSEKDYSYDNLVSKPDMKMTVLDSNVPNNRADIIHQAKKNAAKVGIVNTNDKTVSVFVDDIGRDIVITSDGLRHGMARGKNIQNRPIAIVTLKAGEIIKNSIRINELTPSKESATGSYILIGAAIDNDSNLYLVRSVVNEYGNELTSMDVLYAINTKKESAMLNASRYAKNPLSFTDSTISIAELLDYVNKYFPDILPESVLKHYGYDARPEGEMGESALYSEKGDSVYDTMGETERVLKENEKLRADVERLNERLKLERTVTHGNVLNNNQLLSVAGHLRKISGSNLDKVELANKLKDVYSFINKSENLTWEEVYRRCYVVADAMLNEAKPTIEVNEYYKEILRDVKNARVSLSESQKAEASHIFGKNWNRQFFGKTIIANEGISLEAQWMEWADKYPGIFDKDISDADMIVELRDIITSIKDASEVVVDYDATEERRWLANEVYNQYWNVSSVKTLADRHEKRIKQLNFEHRKAMSEFREDYKARITEQKKADRERYTKLANEIRERKDKEIARAKEAGRERLDRYKENAEKKTRIQSITANALSLNEMLVKNSKDKHIPEVMKGPVTALIKAINFSSKRLLEKGEPTQKDISLQNALGKVKDMMVKATNAHDELVELYGHGLDEDIEKMVDSVDNIMHTIGDNELILNNMTTTDLQTLDKMMRTVKQAVNRLNKFHTVNHAKGIANLSHESVVYMDSLGKTKIYDGKRGAIKKLLDWGNALPYYVFKRYGSGGMKVYEALQDGWDKFAFNTKGIIDYANAAYTNKEVKEWSEDVKTFKILIPASESERNDPDYEPRYQEVQLTVPQIMSMYCLNKREQARGHLFKGGIRVADFKTKKGEIVSQSEGIVFTEKDVQTVFDSLTERQKEVADKLQKFMNTVCTEWGNDVSMARFGYKAFGEENYFPIQSDKNNLAVNDETEQSNSLFKLLNMSFTKSTIDKANNRIVISDIFDVFAQHTSDMAKYNALALPVLDAFKWYNYTEKQDVAEGTFKTKGVKQAIENAFGKDGQNYFTTFLKDINGQQEVSRDTLGNGFFKNAKIASVGANLRVVLLQPTSYARASAVIDNKYLTKALVHKPKINRAETHCGIALWKSMGYYDTNIQKGVEAQIKHSDTWKDKATEWSMKGAEVADKITWGYLWNACELEIRDKRKDLKVGSKEFYDAIGKRLREVIYATQVVDSTMTRSQMMRSTDTKDKLLTAFASEPTLSYNMLQDAYMGLSLDARRMGNKEAWEKNGKKIARTMVAYTMTNALAALVESGFDALRDDDDEEMDMVAFMKLYLKNFASDMSITEKIPYIKEIHSMIQGFSSSRTDTQWMEEITKAITTWYKVFTTGKGKPSTAIKYSIKGVSDLSGIPFYNVYRDTMAVLNKFDLFTAEDLNEMLEDFLD